MTEITFNNRKSANFISTTNNYVQTIFLQPKMAPAGYLALRLYGWDSSFNVIFQTSYQIN